MTTRASILAVTAIAALGSSFLVPGDAFASHHGFAHAAQVSRSDHASIGFHRHPPSSGTVASRSFTQHRFGSANTSVSHSPLASRFSMANRANAPQSSHLNTTHALFDPCAKMPYPASCFHGQGKGVDGTGGSAASLNAKNTTSIGSPVLVPVTEPPIPPSGSNGSGGNTTTTNNKPPTGGTGGTGTGGTGTGGTGTGAGATGGGTGTGTGGTTSTPGTNANNGNNGNKTKGGGNHRHPFPGQFPVVSGTGHGPFVGGPVAVGGSTAPVAVGPVAAAGGATAPVTAPSGPQPPAPSCLSKTYLQTGVVLFRDVCSQEWAINSSNVKNPTPANSACLSKENPQNGVVLFKDNCTSESAMNPQPPDNQAHAN